MKPSRVAAGVFPKRLKEAMELRGLNQAEVADRSGLQASAISHFATGSRKPSFDNLRRLADALDVTTDFLLGRVDAPKGVAAPERLHRHLDRLSSEDLELAEDYLKMLVQRADKRRRKDE